VIENNDKPLKLALHGMDSRVSNTMMLFLQGPCNGAAYTVVDADDADVDVFDGDSQYSRGILETFSQDGLNKPAIVFSMQENFVHAEALVVKKPIKAPDMLQALAKAKKKISTQPPSAINAGMPQGQEEQTDNQQLKTYVYDRDEAYKTSKHKTAMQMDEKFFNQVIGSVVDIDANSPKQFIGDAYYVPQDYYQGYFQAAVGIARSSKQIMLLESDWWPVTLFPRTQEVWLDAGDMELKGFAGIRLNHKIKSAELSLVPVNPETINLSGTLDRFQSIEAFLWKLACWTSQGRYPQDIDYRLPIYLKQWPNFTRLLVTPHGLRIAALLIREPRSMVNIAQTLNIKPQFVFVFVSAAYAVGLVDQAKRTSDNLVQPPDIKPTKTQGLLGHILNKLPRN
jgi:hypothetical protein